MSGHKRTTITISETEYRRLCEADAQSRLLREQLPAMLEKARQEVINTLQMGMQESQQRRQSFHELVETFDRDFQQTEQEADRLAMEAWETMQERVHSLESTLQEGWSSLQDAFFRQIEDWSAFQRETTDWVLAHQQRIENLERAGEWFVANEERKAQIASRWLQHAEAIFHFLRNHYDVERFMPGELEAFADRLRQAYLNLEDGFFDASLIEGQQLYRRLSDMRLSLEFLQNQWLAFRTYLLNGYQNLLTLAEQQQFVQAIDMEGNLLPEQVEVDAWTNGALTRFIHQVKQTIDQILSDQPLMTLETIQLLAKEDFPKRENELKEIVFRARLELLNAQLRVNIADLTVRALQAQGFALMTTRFQSNDMRRAYQVRLRNLEGAEVVIRVDPVSVDYGRNELHLLSLDRPLRTEHELWQRAKVIESALQQYGLIPTGMIEVGEQELHRKFPSRPLESTLYRAERAIQSTRQHHERRTSR